MKQLQVNCYTWEELSMEQKKRTCEMNRTIDLDMLTSEDIIWDMSDAGSTIADAGFLNPEIYYTYSNSQGDGACFDCDMFDWNLLLEDIEIPHKSLFTKLLQDSSNIDYSIIRPNMSYAYHYCHELCREFTLDTISSCPRRVYEILMKIEQHVEMKRREACLDAFRCIGTFIDWAQSDEHLMDSLSTMDNYYREDTLQVVDESLLVEVKEE